MQIKTIAATITVPDELLADADAFRDAFETAINATPEQHREWAAQAAAVRLAERTNAAHVAPSLAAIGERMGWSPAYMEHLCQPYCGCYSGADGWEYCLHARDLGLDAE